MNRNFRNGEGYRDPTAGRVIYNDSQKRKAQFLIRIIRFIVWEAGFRVVNYIELEDRKTGCVY